MERDCAGSGVLSPPTFAELRLLQEAVFSPADLSGAKVAPNRCYAAPRLPSGDTGGLIVEEVVGDLSGEVAVEEEEIFLLEIVIYVMLLL